MTEYLILVDRNDNPTGYEEKTRCHQGKGILHRAFTTLLFDDMGRLLLTRRAPSKMLWPDKWDGTVASHPRKDESYVDAARRRLPEELGLDCHLDYSMKFEYHVTDDDRGSENEICGTLLGIIRGQSAKPNVQEITQTKYVSASDMCIADSMLYCPWMLLALALLPRIKVPDTYPIGPWLESGITGLLLEMVSHHMNGDQWRLLP